MRQNTAEQSRLLSEQLLVMQRSLAFEEQKESVASEPFFRWSGGSSNAEFDSCDFYNEGGPVSDLGIGADIAGVESRVTPRDMIQPNQKATVHFRGLSGPIAKKFTFTISYTTRLGHKGTRRYSLNHGHMPVAV